MKVVGSLNSLETRARAFGGKSHEMSIGGIEVAFELQITFENGVGKDESLCSAEALRKLI